MWMGETSGWKKYAFVFHVVIRTLFVAGKGKQLVSPAILSEVSFA